jgi:hypothetical protein
MNRISHIFYTGETIILGSYAEKGTIAGATLPTAKAKLATADLRVPDDTAPVAITFTVTPREATADVPEGYDLVGDPVSVTGNYCANLAYLSDGKTFKESHIFFAVESSAT